MGFWNKLLGCCRFARAQQYPKSIEVNIFEDAKQNFNCLEVTKMVENRFFGVPCITVCTHPHHVFASGGAKEGSLLTAA